MPELNKRLSALDSTFLFFEKSEAPLHIGSTSIFDGEIDFEGFVANLESKLPLLPRYRQKVVPAPLNIGYPTWEFDTNFNIRKHIIRVEVEQPGGLQQIKELSEKIQMPVLSREKPLWEIYLAYGLEGGNSALIAKVHHAMVDGMSGIDLLKIMLDISPTATPPPAPVPDLIEPKQDFTRRYVDGLLDSVEEGMKSWMNFQTGLLNFTQSMIKETPSSLLKRTGSISPMLATLPTILPFNRPPSGKQKFSWTNVPFGEARAIRANIGGTVNDVVLTVISGAVARYVEHMGHKVSGRNLRIMVPVSMRQEGQRGALGNLVSVMPTEIPMDIKDPLERYKFVSSKTGELKSTRVAEGLNVFSSLLGMVPASIQASLGLVANSVMPVFNIVATNVPGPQIPLYSMGKRMLFYYPYVPVAQAVGLSCAILSYDQRLAFGITVDAELVPDTDILTKFMYDSFAELRDAAGVAEMSSPKVKAEPPKEATREAISNGRKPKAEKASSTTA